MASPEKIVFEQYYQHLRHVENYRHNFTNMFLIFIAAILAFFAQLKTAPEPEFFFGVSVVMLAFSILGCILSWKTGDVVDAYTKTIICMIKKWNVLNFADKLPEWRAYKSVSIAYRAFYVFASIVWLYFSLFYLRSLLS